MDNTMTFGYEKHNADVIENTDKKRICAYFTVLDTHKVSPVSIRLRTEELLEEVAKHDDWILESVIWDANHKIDTNREGLNLILEKARNDEFDIVLVYHGMAFTRSGSNNFDYSKELYQLNRSIYGIVDGIRSFEQLFDALHLTPARQKEYEELKLSKQPTG